jgi:subtilisin family serine protease
VVIVSDAGEPGGGGRATLAAPGRDVLTLVPGGRYDYVSGASFATALVTGVVALMLEHQDLGPEEVATLLEESSRHPDAVLPGVVNACRALTRDPGFPGCGRSFRVGQIPDEPPQK